MATATNIWAKSAFCRYSLSITLWFLLTTITCTYGGCEFPAQWSGRWFQSGVGVIHLNRTNIEWKGECHESAGDKYLVHDRSDDCYRCMAIHEKHRSVLQYKESYCETARTSLADLCPTISGDGTLYSMFRKHPEPRPVPCPFKPAPFTFTYNRGSGECSNPPSRAESCTDESRLVLKYQACPDVPSTESNVEELVCVAAWKEGSARYLLGRLNQVSRRSATVVASDEDQYRCFVYEKVSGPSSRVSYHVAQSGDATCNGLQSVLDGSRTIRLTAADTHHGRCRFPAWITDHHTWLSLDHAHVYKFSLRNATLRITTDDVSEESEVRVVCHSILQSVEQRRVQIVAHVTAGCNSGYVCMMFHKRDAGVIEIQQSETKYENTEDACRYFDGGEVYTTLTAPALKPAPCPHPGRYTVVSPAGMLVQAGGMGEGQSAGRRKRRRHTAAGAEGNAASDSGVGVGIVGEGGGTVVETPAECLSHDYEALAVGCDGVTDTMLFTSTCAHQTHHTAYSCHGSWQESNTHYLIASPVARRSTDAPRYCLIYTFEGGATAATAPAATGTQHTGRHSGTSSGRSMDRTGAALTTSAPPDGTMRLSGLADSCHRHVMPGVAGLWAFNFTTNGGCTRAQTNNSAVRTGPSIVQLVCLSALAMIVVAFSCNYDTVLSVAAAPALSVLYRTTR